MVIGQSPVAGNETALLAKESTTASSGVDATKTTQHAPHNKARH
jgi:hypothetical protein